MPLEPLLLASVSSAKLGPGQGRCSGGPGDGPPPGQKGSPGLGSPPPSAPSRGPLLLMSGPWEGQENGVGGEATTDAQGGQKAWLEEGGGRPKLQRAEKFDHSQHLKRPKRKTWVVTSQTPVGFTQTLPCRLPYSWDPGFQYAAWASSVPVPLTWAAGGFSSQHHLSVWAGLDRT